MFKLDVDEERLKEICHRYGVEFLGVFGSTARGEAREGSDLDLLVKFSPNDKGGLFQLVRMQSDLEVVFGKKVDLLTEGFLSKYFRDEVIAETKPIYVQA